MIPTNNASFQTYRNSSKLNLKSFICFPRIIAKLRSIKFLLFFPAAKQLLRLAQINVSYFFQSPNNNNNNNNKMGQELNEQAENSESFERFLREAGKEAKGDEILKLFLQTWRLVRDLVGKRVAEVARLVETEERVVNSEMLDMPESLKNRILMLKEA